MNLGRLLLRVAIGGFFFGHGTQKLFGWFGGHGLDGTAGFFDSIGIRPGRRRAAMAGAAETGGGLLLAAGLATPLAAASLTSVMLTAIRKVHWKNGPWATEGGYEYNVVLIAAVLALAELGPGEWSLDAVLGVERKGTRWLLGTMGAATIGSLVAAHAREVPPEAGFDVDSADMPTTSEAEETAATTEAREAPAQEATL